MELPRTLSPEQAYNFLITHNPAIEKREAVLHLNSLILLLYNAGYDHIVSLFDRPLPPCFPMTSKTVLIKATEIALNAYSYAIDTFLKTINEDNKTVTKRLPFGSLKGLLRKEIEILNRWYEPAVIALRENIPAGEYLTHPESISLQHFLNIISCQMCLDNDIVYFCNSST